MVIVDMRCLRSVSKIRREPLMQNTSDAMMVQSIWQNSMIYGIKRFLKIEKKNTLYVNINFSCPYLFVMYSPCPKLHAE